VPRSSTRRLTSVAPRELLDGGCDRLVVLPGQREELVRLPSQHRREHVHPACGEVRTARVGGTPFVQVLGVVPTLYDKKWPINAAFLEEMHTACSDRTTCRSGGAGTST